MLFNVFFQTSYSAIFLRVSCINWTTVSNWALIFIRTHRLFGCKYSTNLTITYCNFMASRFKPTTRMSLYLAHNHWTTGNALTTCDAYTSVQRIIGDGPGPQHHKGLFSCHTQDNPT